MFQVEEGFSSFYPPEKMYCEGRDLTETIQHKFPTNFDFGSELGNYYYFNFNNLF